MNNENINDYVSTYIHKGKEDTFGILKIEVESMDKKRSPLIKKTFTEYFIKGDYKLEGITKHALDVSNVVYMDSSGLGTILAFSGLSHVHGNGPISLIGCSESVERFLTIAMVNKYFTIVKKESEL